MNVPAREAGSPFPNYLQLRERALLGPRFWAVGRILAVLAFLGQILLLAIRPEQGLFVFWRLLVPILPLVFLVAPGVWRNVCPLAAANQLPRNLGTGLALTPPAWWKHYGYVAGIVGFFLLASARKWFFNLSAPDTALLLIGAVAAALAGGMVFKGKSGWCSSVCPLYPVQRLYNQTPFLRIPNGHCQTCVGCTKNCYDFNPGVATLADAYDEDRTYAGYRRFFAAAMPGFIVAFFTVPAEPMGGMYVRFGLSMAVSLGLFTFADAFLRISTHRLAALWAAAAFNLFYWFGLPPWLEAVSTMTGLALPAETLLAGRSLLGLLTLVWLFRTFRKEPLFLERLVQERETRVSEGTTQFLRSALRGSKPAVAFEPGGLKVAVEPGRTLLEIAEANRLPIEAGCRMGMCGADPVRITAGMDHLSPSSDDERATLQRLGLGGDCRMACMCRVRGTVEVDLRAKGGSAAAPPPAPVVALPADPAVKRVVIVGNGIAGVTAADHVRRNRPDCEIHLLGRERHHLYNRMAITRLVYGRSAMSGLYLQPDSWYEAQHITCWLNTTADRLDPGRQELRLATGEVLAYDRLILATGSRSFVPPMEGFGLPGSFVLREAEDAMELRAFVQKESCRAAVVAGGGLLGLEAAYALRKLGLGVLVLERGPWLLRRQLDARGAEFLTRRLRAMGIEILVDAEVAAIRGTTKIAGVALKDGRGLGCDVVLVAAGIEPNVELARTAGLEVRKGIVVDEGMRTSWRHILSAGDACEFRNAVPGLWPVAVEQARVAALNALGAEETYRELVPVTTLKVAGVDLTSIGRIEQTATDVVVVWEPPGGHEYRKLVVSGGRIEGAILLGAPQLASLVGDCAKRGADMSSCLEELRAGRWEVLEHAGEMVSPSR